MSEQRPSKERVSVWEHECIVKVNKYLGSYNTQLGMALTMNIALGDERERLLVHTEKVDKGKRGRARPMFATFCPFCGEAL